MIPKRGSLLSQAVYCDYFLHCTAICFLSSWKLFHLLTYLFLNLFIYFWLHWVFVAAGGLSLVAASGGYSSLRVCRLLAAVASLLADHGL